MIIEEVGMSTESWRSVRMCGSPVLLITVGSQISIARQYFQVFRLLCQMKMENHDKNPENYFRINNSVMAVLHNIMTLIWETSPEN